MFYDRNSFEAVTRLCIQLAYGDFDGDVSRYKEGSEIEALEKTAAQFGPSFPIKAYSKVQINNIEVFSNYLLYNNLQEIVSLIYIQILK